MHNGGIRDMKKIFTLALISILICSMSVPTLQKLASQTTLSIQIQTFLYPKKVIIPLSC